MKEEKKSPDKYRICSVDGSSLYKSGCGKYSYTFSLLKGGRPNPDRFNAILDDSLDIRYLRDVVYPKHSKEMNGKHFSFKIGKDKSTFAIIHVTFAYRADESEEGKTKKIREHLYENGFNIDGVHYVRYKRSAGSAREGSCLFIAEPLFEDMMEWSRCGLCEKTVSDKASWEAYISLTLSSIIDTVDIPKKAIMFIPDAKADGGEAEVVCVERGKQKDEETITLSHRKTKVDYQNKIWDGQALLDESVFEEIESRQSNDKTKHGMMLLRNRMFKTCAFRTKLQQFFLDNDIKTVSQLGGYAPYAESIQDVKLVVTESSIKYIKMLGPQKEGLTKKEKEKRFKEWLDEIYRNKHGNTFGIVKQDKKTGPMENQCVYTNYQLINTLSLDQSQVKALLDDSLTLLHLIQTDPMYLRYQSKILAVVDDDIQGDDEPHLSSEEETDVSSQYRYELIRELLGRSDEAMRLSAYKEYRKDLTDKFKQRLKHGRIIVEGNYQTLFGNPVEFLRRTIDEAYTPIKPLALRDGEIYTKRFPVGEALLCARSPHITMGNVFVAKNTYVEEIDRYFCLGDANAIVCVNAIGSHLQQMLNGCDYDSDTMLITNHPVLLQGAIALKDTFPVPYCNIEETDASKDACKEPLLLSWLDIKISQTQVGRIVNLSQLLNCIYWHKKASGAVEADLEEIYFDICQLAALSGIEIDRAKRDMKVSAAKVISSLEKKYKEETKELPAFYVELTKSEKNKSKKASPHAVLASPLSFVFDTVNKDKSDSKNSSEHIMKYLSFFDIPKPKYDQRAKEKGEDKLFALAENVQKKIQRKNMEAKRKKNTIRIHNGIIELLKEKLQEAEKYLNSDASYYYALQKLDQEAESDKRHFVFLYFLCKAHDSYLLHKIKKSEKPLANLCQDDLIPLKEADAIIYGHPHIIEYATRK